MISREELRNKKRILVIGCSGSGKSTISKLLSAELDLEVFHLDSFFFKPGWVMKEPNEFDEIIDKLISKDKWVIDGNYSRTLLKRAGRADLIIYLDFPRYFCLFRIITRTLKTKTGIEIRTDMADGCNERWFDREFYKFVWNFNKINRLRIYEILDVPNLNSDNVLIFRSMKELRKFNDQLF